MAQDGLGSPTPFVHDFVRLSVFMRYIAASSPDGHSMSVGTVCACVPQGIIPVAGADVFEAEMRVRRVVESVYRIFVLGGFFAHDAMMVRPVRAHAGTVPVAGHFIGSEEE